MRKSKFQVKVNSGTDAVWSHLAYVPTQIKDEFDLVCGKRGWKNNDWVSKWAYQDYGLNPIESVVDLRLLRDVIRKDFANEFTELVFGEALSVDYYGWVRAWLVRHMREEIKIWKDHTSSLSTSTEHSSQTSFPKSESLHTYSSQLESGNQSEQK